MNFNSDELKILLERRYCAPEWACIFEVPDQTGGANRRADAMAFNLWPSRGLEVHGFEVKVSRSDWLSELKNPEKSAKIQKFCDYWWIVTPPGIVKDGELPPTWGLLESTATKSTLRMKTKAPKLSPENFSDAFVASLLRCALSQSHDPKWYEQKLSLVHKELLEEKRKFREELEKTYEDRIKADREWIVRFREVTGINLDRWSYGKVLEFFHVWQNKNELDSFQQVLRQKSYHLKQILPHIDKMLELDIFKKEDS